MSIRTIYVKKEQYYTSPGFTGGNTTVFSEIESGVLQSSTLSYTIPNKYGYVISASRPHYDVPPNSNLEPDQGEIDPTSGRVYHSSDERLRMGLLNSFFGVFMPLNILTVRTTYKHSNADWWEKSWTLEDPFGVNVITNYEYFLGNILTYVDNNFPKEMDTLSLIMWMNQGDGTIHIPFLFEGTLSSYDKKFELYT